MHVADTILEHRTSKFAAKIARVGKIEVVENDIFAGSRSYWTSSSKI